MNRIREVDFIKFIAMIMVVSGHAGVSVIKGIPLVHVGLFFVCSGYFLKSEIPFKELIVRNIKKLYIPFIGFQLVFILFHNVLQSEGWFYTEPQHYYLVLEHTFLMDVTEPLLNPIWFLSALNFSIILWGGAKAFGDKLDLKKMVKPLYLKDIILIIFMFVGINLTLNGFSLKYSFMNPEIINVSMVVATLINLGQRFNYIYSKIEKRKPYILSGIFAYVCVFILLKTNSFGVDVRTNRWGNLFIYILALIAVWHFLYVVGTFLMKLNIIYRLVRLVAENTLWIMALHMLGIKIFRSFLTDTNAYLLVLWAMIFSIMIHYLYKIIVERLVNRLYQFGIDIGI